MEQQQQPESGRGSRLIDTTGALSFALLGACLCALAPIPGLLVRSQSNAFAVLSLVLGGAAIMAAGALVGACAGLVAFYAGARRAWLRWSLLLSAAVALSLLPFYAFSQPVTRVY